MKIIFKGGKGSGNFGHAGRPGKRGGSASGSGSKTTNPDAASMEKWLNSDAIDNPMYHVTYHENMATIAEQGLIPKDKPGGQYWSAEHSDHATYFHGSEAGAMADVERFEENAGWKPLLVIAIPEHTESLGKRIFPDEDVDKNPDMGLKHFMDYGASIAVSGGMPAKDLAFVYDPYSEDLTEEIFSRVRAAGVMAVTYDMYESGDLGFKGGKGSGNWGHAGRPGKIGGSGKAMGRGVTGGKLPPDQRVWQGQKHPEKRQLTNIQTGNIGEEMAAKALEDHIGVEFSGLNVGVTNAPIDIAGDHHAVEVKAGPASTGKSAQQWRATIATEGKRERELVRQMSREEKRAYNAYKQQQVFERKNAMVQSMSSMAGVPIKPATVGVILTPDGSRGDVFLFDGFHARIGWNKVDTGTYLGTYEIDDPSAYKEDIFKGGPGSGNFGHAGRPGKVGGSASTKGIEEMLRGRVTITGNANNLPGITANKAFGELEDGTKVLVKPEKTNYTPTGAESEAFAYEVSKDMGWEGLVTPSAIMDDGRNVQQLQKGGMLFDDREWYYGKDPVMDQDFRKIAALDMITGNDDRHRGNILIVERNGQRRLMAIDNDNAYSVNRDWASARYFLNSTANGGGTTISDVTADFRPSEVSNITKLFADDSSYFDDVETRFGVKARAAARSRAVDVLHMLQDLEDVRDD